MIIIFLKILHYINRRSDTRVNLKDRISKIEAAANKTGFSEHNNSQQTVFIPQIKQKQLKKKENSKKALIILCTTLGLVFLLIISIYTPQLFIESSLPNELIETPDKSIISVKENYFNENKYSDFDNDGVCNIDEINNNCNPYNKDTDGDGVLDNIDENPTSFDKTISDSLALEGIFTGSAFEMNGVTMWADDTDSLIKGGVILLPNGDYRITDFKGWVAFSKGNYAYKYEDGKHTLLQHKEKENAWRINDDCIVTVTDEEPEYIHNFSLFGKTSYLDNNLITELISTVLPSKGWITSDKIWLNDTFQDIRGAITASNINTTDDLNVSRFSRNDTELEDIVLIYRTIEQGDSILTSLYSDSSGETIVNVIGYTMDGNLLVQSLDGTKESIIFVLPKSSKTLSENNKVVIRDWVEYVGCGYDTSKGDTISFFASSINTSSQTQNSTDVEETPIIEPDTAPPKPTVPVNGTMKVDGVTKYYIDSIYVTDEIIRKVNKKYEKCNIYDSGAFYVDKEGNKATGKINIDGNTYYYNNGFFLSTFVVCGDTYSEGSQYSSYTVYVDSNGRQINGWFNYGGNYLYASYNNGYIAHNCFVKNENGAYRYLGEDGCIVYNKLITVSGIEIMINENGDIINENYAINAINSNFVY